MFVCSRNIYEAAMSGVNRVVFFIDFYSSKIQKFVKFDKRCKRNTTSRSNLVSAWKDDKLVEIVQGVVVIWWKRQNVKLTVVVWQNVMRWHNKRFELILFWFCVYKFFEIIMNDINYYWMGRGFLSLQKKNYFMITGKVFFEDIEI